MKDSITARSYAKSFLSLGDERSVDIVHEFTALTEAINASGEFENVLFLDVFTADERRDVLKSVLELIKANPLTEVLLSFLIKENRFKLFPLIFKELVVIDDHRKGFLKGNIEGALDELDQTTKARIIAYVESKLGLKVELSYAKSDRISAGYKVKVEDFQVDMTLDGSLKTLL
jgi:F-type H+-transporting ATPase subunit delta